MKIKEIPLTKGETAIVDADVYEELSKSSWHLTSNGYAARRRNGNIELMHRVIMQVNDGKQVDHIDGNQLNNVRENLRIASNSQNNMNKGLQSNNTSGYKGVSWDSQRKVWRCYVWKEGKRYYVGSFKNKHEAAKAYNEKARELHGEFVRLNFLKVNIQKIHPDAVVPKYAKPYDAGFDLSAIDEGFLLPGERVLIGTGLVFEIPEGYEMQIRSRSGLAAKHGIAVLNAPGTVDAGFRNEVKVILVNHGYETFEIKKGDRIAQGVVKPVEQVEFELAEKLSETERGGNGFGSTGV